MTEIYFPYDYAWKTPGWNAQNPTFIQPAADGYVDPGLPEDVTKVRLYGEFLDFESGRPLEGYLEIRTSDELTYLTTNTRVMPGVKKIRFNRGGFDITLPASDDPNLSPEFLYQARLTVAGRTNAFQFGLSSVETVVNINDLIPPQEGSITLVPALPDDGIELGAVPAQLTVNLTTGSDFNTTLVGDTVWDEDTVVTLKVGALTWTATLSGRDAVFSVDKTVADTVLDGTAASLRVTNGSDDEVWAVGRVVRHDGTQ